MVRIVLGGAVEHNIEWNDEGLDGGLAFWQGPRR